MRGRQSGCRPSNRTGRLNAYIRFPSSRRFDELDIEGNAHFLADQYTAGFKGCVPPKSEILAVDLCSCGKANPRIAPGVLCGLAHFLDIQNHRLSDAVNGQVASDRKAVPLFLDMRRLEGHCREFFHVEKVGALEMAVALLILRIDGADINGNIQGGLGMVGFKAMQDATDSAELASDVGDHHVLDLELGAGMGRIDVPGGSGSG